MNRLQSVTIFRQLASGRNVGTRSIEFPRLQITKVAGTFVRLVCAVVACQLVLFIPVAASDNAFAPSKPVPEMFAAGFNSITEADSESTLRMLVEGEMSGRGTGQEGYLKAARWYSEQLALCGFQPGGTDGSWFQNVPFIKMTVVKEKCSIKLGADELIGAKAMGISDFAGDSQQSIPVTFVSLGSTRPEPVENQFAGQLVVVRATGRLRYDDPFLLKTKPSAILIVTADARVRDEAVNQTEDTPSQTPVVMVTLSSANALASRCGVAADFFKEADSEQSLIVSSSVKVDCQIAVERESIDVPNVVGWFPGSDPEVQNEHICIGCHLDHLGVQRGETYPGADDNGSGSTAILQVARAIHANPVKPKRGVLLIAFCAEERGLLGSKFYAKNPLRPLKDMICMLNIDMVGRNEETTSEPASQNENTIHLVGSKDHSMELHELTLAANESVGFVFEYDEEDRVDGRSDHASFSEKGIPVTFLFGGFNPHYHKPTDTLDGINFSKIANAARLNYLTLMMAVEHGRFEATVK